MVIDIELLNRILGGLGISPGTHLTRAEFSYSNGAAYVLTGDVVAAWFTAYSALLSFYAQATTAAAAARHEQQARPTFNSEQFARMLDKQDKEPSKPS